MTQNSKGVAKNFSRNCKIPEEFRVRQDVLPTLFEQYLDYYRAQVRRMHSVYCMRIIISGLNLYLQKSNIALFKISTSFSVASTGWWSESTSFGTS